MKNLIFLVLAIMVGIALLGWIALKWFGMAPAIITVILAMVIVVGLAWLFFRNLTID